MLLGKMFNPLTESESQDFAEYIKVGKATVECNFKVYEQLNQKYQKVWLKRGIYLLMDRLRVLLWRNIVKRLFLILGNKVDM